MATTQKLLSAEDLFTLPDDGVRRELLDGELVEMSPTGPGHARVMVRVAHHLLVDVEPHNLGEVFAGDLGVILRRHPDRVRAPDVCFFARERIPSGGFPEGYVEIVPDLIVEIVSPNDKAAEVQEKIQEWLHAGARLVWAIYPGTRQVMAYQGRGAVRVYEETDTLDGGPVLPDFSCPLAKLFT